MKVYKVVNLGAGQSRELMCAGSDFFVLKEAPFDVVIQIDDGEKLEITKGTKIRNTNKFKKGLRVINESKVTLNCTFVVGNGDYKEPQIIGEVETKNKPLQGIKTTIVPIIAADGEFVAIGANQSRHALRAKVTGNAGVLVGGVDVVSNGYLLKPGEELPICSASGAELYVAAETTDTEIRFLEEYENVNYSLDISDAVLTESGAVLYDESGNILTV